MIISHKHKFIFFHCRKIAGSSIKTNLNNILGDEDIIIGSANEILDLGQKLPRVSARRIYSVSGACGYLASRCLFKGHNRSINNGIKLSFFWSLGLNPAHPDAKSVKKCFNHEFESYEKIGFVRNPWEQVVSDFNWRVNATGATGVQFSDFVEDLYYGTNATRLVPRGMVSNWRIISIDDELILNRIGRFESLDDDFSAIFATYSPGLRLSSSAKVSGTTHEKYHKWYCDRSASQVYEMFSREIELLGYHF
jgi:hypothetical protein